VCVCDGTNDERRCEYSEELDVNPDMERCVGLIIFFFFFFFVRERWIERADLTSFLSCDKRSWDFLS